MAEKMELKKVEVWDGNLAAAHSLRQAQVDVVSAYPITPSTPIVETFAKFLADGYVDGEYMMVESEHAAMSGCIGASAAGGRVATATSAQGFALMVETLYQASGMRLPIVLHVVNRALASPLNVNGDHSDMYLGRDSGWIQLDTFSPQEVYDMGLMAFKIGEDHDVRLPVMVHQDGFISSHTAQNVSPLSDDEAYEFVGEFKPMNAMLDFEKPISYGVQTEEDWHFEHKARQHNDLMTKVFPKIDEVFQEFEKKTGRKYKIVEDFYMDDARVAIVALGTTVETAKLAARILRKEEKIKAGVVGIRVLRPFPFEQLGEVLKKVKAIGTLDRSSPNGTVGMLYNEISGVLMGHGVKSIVLNYVYGLGGRDITVEMIKNIFRELDQNRKARKRISPVQQFVNLRGPKLEYFDASLVNRGK
ncbi:MAG TPA: 2-oxoacid:ferredoxin oxidoreductase subunit alpha [Campylobacterales bacterium]|nr:2-oxoacid:ferredoxin oxidoreductase subunit alpha [Campylobacterales bacterium]HIO70831.1 2-oxoacid:ferredoxin oxidoreductase subunit alpha [Campylobacterales bacterium]